MIKIAIASHLKPVDEVRIYKRFGLSIAKTNIYDVNIIGIQTKNKLPAKNNITFHFLPNPGRQLLTRVKNLIFFYQKLKKLKPELIIVTSPEQLLVSYLFLKKYEVKLIYDIQEDYYKNITFLSTYPIQLKWLIGSFTRLLEKHISKKIALMILAEKTYANDISFVKKHKNIIILENKYPGKLNSVRGKKSAIKKLVFTGTISDYSGIDKALTVYERLSQNDKNITLKIVGKCHHLKITHQLRKLAASNNKILVVGLDTFVSHDEIIHAINEADLAICGYEPNEVNQNKIPSKLFEYIALSKPTVLVNHKPWKDLMESFQLGISIDFNDFTAKEIRQKYLSLDNSAENTNIESVLWDSISDDLIRSISTLNN